MKFIDLQRLSLDEMTATSSESGIAEPNTATAAASSLPPAARELGALVSLSASLPPKPTALSPSSSFRRLSPSRPRKDSEAAVHAALPEIISVGVAAAKNPNAIYPIEASWDVESFSQHEFVRLMERPWYVRRASCAASPRRSAPSQRRREYPHRVITSSHRNGGRVAVARQALATTRSFDRARGGTHARFGRVRRGRERANLASPLSFKRHRHSVVVAPGWRV